MTIDINTIISEAITKEINEIIRPFADKINTLVIRLQQLQIRTNANWDAICDLSGRTNNQAAVPVDEIPDDYFKRDALTTQFIEKLNNQEWFWNKVNAYVDTHIERMHGTPVDRHEASDIAKEVFEAEWGKKVGSNDLLGRDEVAEVFKELWVEDYEGEVEEIAERVAEVAVEEHDFNDQIKRALRDATISIDI